MRTDQVGACAAVLQPLFARLRMHVFAAERLHGDDTTVPVLAKGGTTTGRCWTYVRDEGTTHNVAERHHEREPFASLSARQHPHTS